MPSRPQLATCQDCGRLRRAVVPALQHPPGPVHIAADSKHSLTWRRDHEFRPPRSPQPGSLMGCYPSAVNCGRLEPRPPAEETGLLPARAAAHASRGVFPRGATVSAASVGEGEPESSALTAQPRPLASQVTSAFHLVERVRGGGGRAVARTLRGSAGLTASSCPPTLPAPLRASPEPGAAVGQGGPSAQGFRAAPADIWGWKLLCAEGHCPSWALGMLGTIPSLQQHPWPR